MAVRIYRNNDATQVLFTGVQITAIPCNTHTAEIVDTDFIRIYDHTSPTQARIINKLLWSEIQDQNGNAAGTDAATTLSYVNRQLNTNLATSVYNAGRIDGLFMSIEDNGDTLRVTAGKCLAQVGDKLEEVILSDDFVYPVSNVTTNGQDKIFTVNINSNENVVISEIAGALNGAAIPDDVRTECFLGIIFFNDFQGKFTFAQSMSVSAKNVGSSLYDLAQVLNPRIIPTDRPIISKSVNSDMRLGVSAGRIFAFGSNLITGTDADPNIYSHEANTDITYLQIAEPNGSGLWQINQLGQMQTFAGDNIWTKYDDKSGTLQDVPADYWVLMPVTMTCGQIQQGPILAMPTVYAAQHIIPDANFQINQESEAVNALQTYEFPNLTLETSAIIGVIAMRQDATSLADTDKVRFYSGDAQYLQASGISRAMAAIAEIKAQYKGTWDASTNTPDISAGSYINGDWFVVNVAGSYDGVDYVVNDEIRYNGSEWERIPYAGVLIEYDSSQVLLNSNAAVYADGAQGLPDPNGTENGWYFTNDTAGKKINWYFVGSQNVGYEITRSSLKNGWARVVMTKTTGDIFMNVYTTPQADGQDVFWYRSEYTYTGADFSGVAAGQEVLIYWGEEPTVHPSLARIELTYDNDTSTVSSAALDTDAIFSVALSTNSAEAVGNNEFVVKEVGYKNGLYVQSYLLESSLDTNTIDPNAYKDLTDTTVDFQLDATSTSVMLDNGYAFGVNTIKAIADTDGTIHIVSEQGDLTHFHTLSHTDVTINGLQATGGLNDVVNALNELFTVGAFEAVVISDPYSTVVADVAGVDVTGGLAGSAINPSGADVGAGTVSHTNHGGFKSVETIDQAGEYFSFDIRVESVIGMGLVLSDASYANGDYVGNATYANPATFCNGVNSAHYGYQFSHWFHPSPNGPWTNYGANTSYVVGPGWSNLTTGFRYTDEGADWLAGTPVKMRVGIDTNSFISIDYYDASAGVWYSCARSSYPIAEGVSFHLGIKFGDTVGRLFTTPKIHELEPAAPTMFFRYIESPDGNFNYPLFASEEEANYYDLQSGGSGTSHQHVYVDDPTMSTWYMPDTGMTMGASSAPTGTETFESNLINWTEITSLTDADLVPPAFTDTTITVNELSAVNYQLSPIDAGYTTTIGGIPNWSIPDGRTLQGTAPEVTGDNVANPSDTTTVTVYRTNSYGTSQGTLTIEITNLTAPTIIAITGFTHDATSTALAADNTMGDGSVVALDETIDTPYRMLFLRQYVETYILPNLSQAGDKYIIGKLASGFDVSTLEVADYEFAIAWEYVGTSSHRFVFYENGVSQFTQTVNSLSSAFYDYAIEIDGTSAWLIACNVNAINTEPSPSQGGSFTNTHEVTSIGAGPHDIHLGNIGTDSTFGTAGFSEIITPTPDNWIQVTESGNVLSFDGSTTFPTLQAGYTYRLLMGEHVWADQTTDTQIKATEIVKFTADGSTEYDMGATWVQSGTVGAGFAYIEFTVPTDVPPLHWYASAAHNPINQDLSNVVAISGSTYVAPVTGITQEGPAVNQTGTNLFNDPAVDADGVVWGWLSIDEQLSAGERLVLDNAFMVDLTDAMPNNSGVFIGLKSGTWTNSYRNNSIANATYAGARFAIYRYSASDIRVFGYIVGATTIGRNFGTNGISIHNLELAFEITNSGNNIRLMMGSSNNSSDNVNSTAYADWSSSYKTQTGDQGFGITSLDIMVLGDANITGSAASSEMDTADVDWTGLSEINVPTPAVTNDTSWTKALDFSGSSERAEQVSSNTDLMPIAMDNISATASGHATAGYTSGHIYSRPWATAIVFNSDGNNSNQHIWNQGEGAGSTDDNIYVRVTATNQVYFGWGRDGALNECYLGNISPGSWYGLYIAHTGERLSGANATANNLADCFDIRWVTLSSGQVQLNRSIASNWTSTGGRMDRSFTTKFSIGGRGANRNFHGKVASMVVTTLRINQPMPTTVEIATMVTDPKKWINDYKDNKTYRVAFSQQEATFIAYDYLSNSAFATQVWLMGDGILDNYSNHIRNQVYPQDQNYTRLNLISMVSNDIQNVTINGLT